LGIRCDVQLSATTELLGSSMSLAPRWCSGEAFGTANLFPTNWSSPPLSTTQPPLRNFRSFFRSRPSVVRLKTGHNGIALPAL